MYIVLLLYVIIYSCNLMSMIELSGDAACVGNYYTLLEIRGSLDLSLRVRSELASAHKSINKACPQRFKHREPNDTNQADLEL